jgi:hypothetical protein
VRSSGRLSRVPCCPISSGKNFPNNAITIARNLLKCNGKRLKNTLRITTPLALTNQNPAAGRRLKRRRSNGRDLCAGVSDSWGVTENPQVEDDVHTSTCGTIDPLWIWRLLDLRIAIGISRSSLNKFYPAFDSDGIEFQHCLVTDVAHHSANGSGAHFAEISHRRLPIRKAPRMLRASTLFAETLRWTTPPWPAF